MYLHIYWNISDVKQRKAATLKLCNFLRRFYTNCKNDSWTTFSEAWSAIFQIIHLIICLKRLWFFTDRPILSLLSLFTIYINTRENLTESRVYNLIKTKTTLRSYQPHSAWQTRLDYSRRPNGRSLGVSTGTSGSSASTRCNNGHTHATLPYVWAISTFPVDVFYIIYYHPSPVYRAHCFCLFRVAREYYVARLTTGQTLLLIFVHM